MRDGYSQLAVDTESNQLLWRANIKEEKLLLSEYDLL
jgi:hypothetical protein